MTGYHTFGVTTTFVFLMKLYRCYHFITIRRMCNFCDGIYKLPIFLQSYRKHFLANHVNIVVDVKYDFKNDLSFSGFKKQRVQRVDEIMGRFKAVKVKAWGN